MNQGSSQPLVSQDADEQMVSAPVAVPVTEALAEQLKGCLQVGLHQSTMLYELQGEV